MRRGLAFSFLLVPLLFSLLPAQESSSLDGSVVDSLTGAGIAGAVVYLGGDQGVHYEAVTGPSGLFHIEGIKAGEYGIHFAKTGYIPQYSGTNGSSLKPLRIAAGQDSAPLRGELVPFGTLRGRVVDPDGKPVANAAVALGIRNENTGGRGEFTFADLPPGSYTLEASPSASAPPYPTPTAEDRAEPVTTWFPSVTEKDQAESIAVAAGAHLSGYDIRLRAMPVYRVRGIVLGEDGKPAPLAFVSHAPGGEQPGAASNFTIINLTSSFGFFAAGRGTAVSDADPNTKDGVFEFPSVPRGTRRFMASHDAKDAAGHPITVTAAVTAVVDHDIEDLQLRFRAPFTIEGSFELAGAPGSKASPPPFVNLIPEDGSPAAIARVSAGGALRFDHVAPGRYRIVAQPGMAGGYYLASVTLGGRDVAGQTVDLEPGEPQFQLIYRPNAGSVSGKVDTVGNADIAAVLIPEAEFNSLVPETGRASQGRTDGTFEIAGVQPGIYYALALPAKHLDPRTLQRLRPGAVRVEVAEGSAVSLQLKAIELPE